MLSKNAIPWELVFFVGRTQELDTMRRHAAGRGNGRWLHLYGPSGIGKSTLLRKFQSELRDVLCLAIDGRKVLQEPHEAIAQLAAQLRKVGEIELSENDPGEVTDCLNRRAQGNGAVLLIDGFDHWHAIEHWFLEWIDRLEPTIRIVTTGRNGLAGGWLRSERTGFVHTMRLQPLPAGDVKRYALQRGIRDRDRFAQLYRYSGGIPLAMALTAEAILQGGASGAFDPGEQYRLISALMTELLQGLPSPAQRSLEAASVYWHFNEERLNALLDGELDTDAFRRFVGLPFVHRKPDGWVLHDAVRAWALEDLQLRKPNAYETMRRKALLHIRKEERDRPHLRHKLQIEKMNLHEHPIVRGLCFAGPLDDDIEVRACRPCDVPAMRRLYVQFHRFAVPSADEAIPMEPLIESVYDIAPDAFIAIWQRDAMIAFFSKIPLTDRIVALLKDEPLFQPFLRAWDPVPNAYLFSLIGIAPELEEKTRAFITNTLMNHFSRSEWILDFTCLKEWFPVFELCGFERAPWADAATPSGTEYRGFALDLRQEDFLTKLDRSVSRATAPAVSAPSATPERLQELKTVLKHWNALPRKPELLLRFRRLFPHVTQDDSSAERMGAEAQRRIEEGIRRLEGGGEEEAMLGKLLSVAYLQGVRPNELAAKALNVSPATYYRYLQKALEALHELLSLG